ncbi:hypothetical protein [Microbacterium maritypicum]|uniref:Peptidase M15B domain-containing protein n=2 Tax=Microbacterium TaxID=33882 RepID=T5KKV2_MICMQ|nr:hypothetical protein [Microbacterium liquefaciens]EQM75916.1 hypothetical protein L687_18570 [Microbacterium maritypicum MF109]
MSALDIIPIPGHAGMFARRIVVEAWQAAGSPPINSAGRLYKQQLYYWDGWRLRLPGFNPADNPDDESQALAHVRFGALDIDPTPERIRKLEAAGLVRPYKYEPWHWELPNVRQYAIVRTIPASAGGATPTPIAQPFEETEMYFYVQIQGKLTTWILWIPGRSSYQTTPDSNQAARWRKLVGRDAVELTSPEVTELQNVAGLFRG